MDPSHELRFFSGVRLTGGLSLPRSPCAIDEQGVDDGEGTLDAQGDGCWLVGVDSMPLITTG